MVSSFYLILAIFVPLQVGYSQHILSSIDRVIFITAIVIYPRAHELSRL